MEVLKNTSYLYDSDVSLSFGVHIFNGNASNVSICESPTVSDRSLITVRFWLMCVLGTCLALIGVVQNSILYYLFTSRSKFRESAIFFLSYVALFDAALDMGYVFVITVQVFSAYFNLHNLHAIWCYYIRYAMAFTRVCKLTSTLCLIAASLERYRAASLWTFTGFHRNTRILMLVLAIIGGCVVRGPIVAAIQITFYPMCHGFARYRAFMMLVSHVSKALHVIETTVGVGLPFALLIYLNVGIVFQLHQQRVRELRNLMLQLAVSKTHIDEHDDRIRHATRTLGCLVFAYLLSNALDVLAAAWELYDENSILRLVTFHRITQDLISLFTVLGNVVRLHIYAQCDPDIHRALRQMCCQRSIQGLQASTTSVDNIEKALHNNPAINRLRRLSQRLHSGQLSELERRSLRAKLLVTMSALHLDQSETLHTPFQLENSNYLSVTAMNSSNGAISPRNPSRPLSDLFVPDIDLLFPEHRVELSVPDSSGEQMESPVTEIMDFIDDDTDSFHITASDNPLQRLDRNSMFETGSDANSMFEAVNNPRSLSQTMIPNGHCLIEQDQQDSNPTNTETQVDIHRLSIRDDDETRPLVTPRLVLTNSRGSTLELNQNHVTSL